MFVRRSICKFLKEHGQLQRSVRAALGNIWRTPYFKIWSVILARLQLVMSFWWTYRSCFQDACCRAAWMLVKAEFVLVNHEEMLKLSVLFKCYNTQVTRHSWRWIIPGSAGIERPIAVEKTRDPLWRSCVLYNRWKCILNGVFTNCIKKIFNAFL